MSDKQHYSLIIVDDEPAIRQGLVQYVDWDSLGFKVCGAMEDGREAMAFIQNNPVDAVLTDIRMSDISGLDLAEYINENHPEIQVLIMSGYQEFEYARRAIMYNVRDYLLKPVEFSDLKRIFRQLYEEISEKTALQEIKKHLSDGGEDFFNALLRTAQAKVIDSDEDLDTLIKKVTSPAPSKDASSYITAIIGKARAYMKEHYNEDISLDDVAGHVYQSPVYFSRFFKEKTGENFISYLTSLRMEEAKNLLIDGRHKIFEISEKVGYQSSKYFTRVFKGYFGITPTEYIHTRMDSV